MTDQIAESSPRSNARIAGVVYLLYFLAAVLAQFFISRKLVVDGNVVNVIANALYLALTVLFYLMFKPVNRNLSLLAALFSLAGCAIGLLGIFHLASSVSPLLFFGWYCLVIGMLILRSNFLPRPLGWLMAVAGLGWLAYLIPSIAKHLSMPIQAVGIVAETSLMLWLLVKGVNEERWKQLASVPIESFPDARKTSSQRVSKK